MHDFIAKQGWSMTLNERDLVWRTLLCVREWVEKHKSSEINLRKVGADLHLRELEPNVRHIVLATLITVDRFLFSTEREQEFCAVLPSR